MTRPHPNAAHPQEVAAFAPGPAPWTRASEASGMFVAEAGDAGTARAGGAPTLVLLHGFAGTHRFLSRIYRILYFTGSVGS